VILSRWIDRDGAWGWFLLTERYDGVEQFAPVADYGHPEVLKIVRSQRWQDFGINGVVEERLLVMVEPEFPEPGRDIHSRSSVRA
jgi:hypothetical protein